MEDTYVEMFSRQILVEGIGVRGQKILRGSRVAVVGAGAIGSSVAELLARIGVGFIRIIDRDIVDLSNIARCHLLDYSDYVGRKPKSLAVAEKLSKINPYVSLDPVIDNIDSRNVVKYLKDVDLVIDGLDNMESKQLLNEAAVMLGKPYIYVGIEGTYGMVLPVIPRTTPCLRCMVRDIVESDRGCGVIGTHIVAVSMVSSLAVSIAIKILLGRYVESNIYYIDSSKPEISALKAMRSPTCPVCSLEKFELLSLPPVTTGLREICGTPGAYIAEPSIIESIEPNEWHYEDLGYVKLYKKEKDSIEIYVFKNHALVLNRGGKDLKEIFKANLTSRGV
ncbi:MAG TPA: HesA/MoeB/ThiF family protein [Sulfolobales archaeon]|nr:HesA/MoeB/ThiF family protein [Sulfolobales archaeon]